MRLLNQAISADRYDLYGPIHRGLRRAHALMLMRLGAADYSHDMDEILRDLKSHLHLSATHLLDEDSHIHLALEKRAPGASRQLAHQHDHHRDSLKLLADAIRGIEKADTPDIALGRGRELYMLFSIFVADDLVHMAEEENEIWPLLCSLFSDEELRELEMAIVAGLDPETNAAFLAHVVPAASEIERAAMLTGMKAAMPPCAYADMVEAIVIPHVTDGERRRLVLAELV